MKKITLLLAEDHVLVREGLRALFGLSDDIELIGEAAQGRIAVALTIKLKPDIVIMDIAMPDLNGFEATRQILQAVPKTKVLVLSAHQDDEYVSQMAAIGASGYLLKQNSGTILLKAVREVAQGRMFFTDTILQRLKETQRFSREHYGSPNVFHSPLSTREAEVLQLVAEGCANKQVASKLSISIKTVEKHRQRLMDKLNIHETAGLTRFAIATGVVESSVQRTTVADSPAPAMPMENQRPAPSLSPTKVKSISIKAAIRKKALKLFTPKSKPE